MTPPTDAAPAWLFPGQGAQKVGMGQDLYDTFPEARAIFDRADAALDRPLSDIIFNGPDDTLLQTINAQPAILVTSLACLAAAKTTNPLLQRPPAYVAGHSLGEYTALVAAGAISLDDGIRLVQERGRLMQAAGDANPGTLAAILGLADDEVEAVCRETGAEICNLNSATQIVIGGPHPAVARAMDLAKARGARRAIPLKVSGAFHSSLMQPAAEALQQHLNRVDFHDPQFPVIANVTALPMRSVSPLREELIQQVQHAVRWRQSVELMVDAGVRTFVEIGPGGVLTGLVKSIAKDVKPTLITVSDVDTIRASA